MEQILTGQSTAHLVEYRGFFIHHQAVEAWQKLAQAADQAGFDLRVVSAFRSYEQQLVIWNEKAQGKRPLLNAKGKALEHHRLLPPEILEAILRWSAIPGASRHHWGTEFDVYDFNALEVGQKVELTPPAVAGPFAPLHLWLDEHLSQFNFFRPYHQDQGGIYPEQWHLSYRPLAQQYFKSYDLELFGQTIATPRLQLGELIRARAKEIFDHYVRNICSAPGP